MPNPKKIWNFIMGFLERMDKIHLGLIAAGIAFYAMFAVFPGIAAIISLWSLFFDPEAISAYLEVADEFIPEQAAGIIHDQVDDLLAGGRSSIGWTSFISIAIATISARAGVGALIRGLNAIHGVRSHSTIFGFFLAYILTLAIVGVVLAGLVTIVVIPIVLNFIDFGPAGSWMLTALPWIGTFAIGLIGIGIIYRYGPNLKAPKTPIFTWGALIATLMWAAASFAFSAYLSSFNSYNRVYGSIGAVVALLMWFYLAGFSVLFGALLNVELRRQRTVREARLSRKTSSIKR